MDMQDTHAGQHMPPHVLPCARYCIDAALFQAVICPSHSTDLHTHPLCITGVAGVDQQHKILKNMCCWVCLPRSPSHVPPCKSSPALAYGRPAIETERRPGICKGVTRHDRNVLIRSKKTWMHQVRDTWLDRKDNVCLKEWPKCRAMKVTSHSTPIQHTNANQPV